jgi:2-furoyl-CoA dehydrogenase large subunit
MDPSGAVTVKTVSTPAGQGHATVAAQVVADALGLHPNDVDVITEVDTVTSAWSIASGNYANRFSSVVVSAIAEAAEKVAAKIKLLASDTLEIAPEDVELVDGQARLVGVPAKSVPIRRLASRTHWHPAGLPEDMSPGIFETSIVSPRLLGSPDEQDRVASAVTFGYVCDLAAVEVDRATGRVHVKKYVSVHDVGTILNHLVVEGQIYGGFAHGIGGAFLEEFVYDDDGNPLSGTFADYLCVTAPEVPKLTIGHISTPSPHNVLGSKGMGDGSSMLAPTAIANAVADALGRRDIELPLTLNRVWALANGRTYARPGEIKPKVGAGPAPPTAGGLTGQGEVVLPARPEEVWRLLLDPAALAAMVPGCRELKLAGPDRYEAEVEIGVASVRGAYAAAIDIRDKREPESLRLIGRANGALGFGRGTGWVELHPVETGTRLSYRYEAHVGGKLAAVGSRMLGTVTRILIGQFFRGFERRLAPSRPGVFGRLFGGRGT